MARRGMVFGVFDGLHEGHRHFLSEAAKRCGELVVVVARDETSAALKGRVPREALGERLARLRAWNPSLVAVWGDKALGDWAVVGEYAPDIIFLGHDQRALGAALAPLRIPLEFLGKREI